ncbi:hypothetical protein HY643_03895 [Candidatus Woesearchaeota archaeon]|nr:hypothetical protein [Candidatus Woesearchaeota archaeon]
MGLTKIIKQPLTIAIGIGLSAGTFSSMLLAKHLNYKNTHRPISIIQLEKQQQKAVEASKLAHNTSMHINELWNFVNTPKVEDSMDHLQEKNNQIIQQIAETQQALTEFEKDIKAKQPLAQKISQGGSLIKNSWDYWSRDNYHTEFDTVRDCDSDGNCTSRTVTRQVYDNTDHYWTYESQKCLLGANILIEEVPKLKVQKVEGVNLSTVIAGLSRGGDIKNLGENPQFKWTKNKIINLVNEASSNAGKIEIDADIVFVEKNSQSFPTSFHQRTYWMSYTNAPRGYEESLRVGKVTSRYNENITDMLSIVQKSRAILGDAEAGLNKINYALSGVYTEFGKVKKVYAGVSEDSLKLLDSFGFDYGGVMTKGYRALFDVLMFFGVGGSFGAASYFVLDRFVSMRRAEEQRRAKGEEVKSTSFDTTLK